jgi:fatty acid desaturase 6
MFVAPVLLPPFAPLVSIAGLIEKRSVFGLLKFICRAGLGLWIIVTLLMKVSNYSLLGAILIIWASRAVLSIPYIHVNIFQHIGLPMYSKENKPVRIYQMATGVLNLPRNPILDFAFGHSIISCHVEHHLFPKLSDNMCLKIKPVVSKFLKENGLPYNEKPYLERLKLFIDKYDTLMVNAPPITHFVGLQ